MFKTISLSILVFFFAFHSVIYISVSACTQKKVGPKKTTAVKEETFLLKKKEGEKNDK